MIDLYKLIVCHFIAEATVPYPYGSHRTILFEEHNGMSWKYFHTMECFRMLWKIVIFSKPT